MAALVKTWNTGTAMGHIYRPIFVTTNIDAMNNNVDVRDKLIREVRRMDSSTSIDTGRFVDPYGYPVSCCLTFIYNTDRINEIVTAYRFSSRGRHYFTINGKEIETIYKVRGLDHCNLRNLITGYNHH